MSATEFDSVMIKPVRVPCLLHKEGGRSFIVYKKGSGAFDGAFNSVSLSPASLSEKQKNLWL